MYQGLGLDYNAVAQAPVQAGVANSTCTIQQPDGTLTASGKPSGTFVNVAGMVSIQCVDAPESAGGLSANETNVLSEIESMAYRHVNLCAYFSQLGPSTNWGNIGWRAVITNTVTGQVQTYDIRGAEPDSGQSQTRLKLRKVTV